jgi:hypothetical protein
VIRSYFCWEYGTRAFLGVIDTDREIEKGQIITLAPGAAEEAFEVVWTEKDDFLILRSLGKTAVRCS